MKTLLLCCSLLSLIRLGTAQQILAERVLRHRAFHLIAPTAALAPNGECLITAGAHTSLSDAYHSYLFVSRVLPSTCDTLWQRWMPHTAESFYSAIAADTRSVWVLTPDTAHTIPPKGVRLWRFGANGTLRGIVRPVPRTLPN